MWFRNLFYCFQESKKLKQLYMVLIQCNQAIAISKTKSELFENICKNTVELGGMKMIWIGMVDRENKLVSPVAFYGKGTDYLKSLKISIDPNNPNSNGPTGQAFIKNEPFWCQDFVHDLHTTIWHEHGRKYGWGSSAAIPLLHNKKVVGLLSLYTKERNFFDKKIQKLIKEVAIAIGYALDNLTIQKQSKQRKEKLFESYSLLNTIINTLPIRVFWKDKNLNYLGCNYIFAQDAKVLNPDALIGKNDKDLSWKNQASLYHTSDKNVLETGKAQLFFEEQELTPWGNTIWFRKSKIPLKDKKDETIGVLGIYEDITKRKLAEEKSRYLANYDLLTGLPNRTYLNTQIEYLLKIAKREEENIAILLLDLDRFKDINDTLGHNTGDLLLIESAKRLKRTLREMDIISRFGGDEFIVLLPNSKTDSVGKVAQKLIDVIKKSFLIEPSEQSSKN